MKDRIIRFIKRFRGISPTKKISPLRSKKVSPWHILITVADAFEIREEWIVRLSRKRCHVVPRHVYFYFYRKLLPQITLQTIAQTTNRKSHSTVLHGIKSIKRRMQSDPKFSNKINQIGNDLE